MAVWIHNDTRGAEAIPQAIRRAIYRKWGAVDEPYALSDGDRMADLRALTLATAWTVANLSGAVEIVDSSGRLQIDGGKLPADHNREVVARALLRTWTIVMGPASSQPDGRTVQTLNGSRALIVSEASGWPLAAAVVVIAAIGIYAAYSYFAGAKDADVAVQRLQIDDNHARMLETHARVLQVWNEHAAQEKAAGKILPLTENEKAAVAALLKSQENAAKGVPPPLGTDSNFTGTLGAALGSGLTMIVVMIAAALFLKKET